MKWDQNPLLVDSRIKFTMVTDHMSTKNLRQCSGRSFAKCMWENAAAFPYDVYVGFQRKEQTVAVAIDLKDAYNKVKFKLLMDLLIQYGVSLTLTRWVAGVLLERTVVMQLGVRNWSSAPHQLTMGLPQGSPLSPVLFNVYTKGLADLNGNGPNKTLTLADDRLLFKTSKDSQEAAEAVPQQLDSVSQWCHDTRSLLDPDKAETLRCALDNRAAGKAMPAVTSDGVVVEWTSHLRYSGIHFDGMLTKPTCGNNSVSLQGCGCKRYWMPPLPAVSKCGAHCHWLWTGPPNNGTDKSAEAGQSAEWSNASHTGNHQGYTHWDHEVHARRPTNASQTECGAGLSILQCCRKSPQPTPWSRERHKGMQTGTGQVLEGSSIGLNSASMPADRAQANQGVGKVSKLILASLWDTPARKPGKSRQNRVRDQASQSRKWHIHKSS